MKNSLLFLLLLHFSSNAFSAGQLTVIGDAYDLEDQSLLYQEYHYYSADKLDHRVVYKNPEREDIAVKTVDYRSGYTTPAFNQQSLIYTEELSVSMSDDDLLIRYLFGGSDAKEQLVSKKQPLVIDAGFDNYIRENWQALVGNEMLTFYFPAVTRQSLIKLRIVSQPCSYETTTDKCFALNSASWVIRLVLDPIELGYDKDAQRLTRFRGLANLSDDKGDGLKVDIKYRYEDICDTSDNCPPLESSTSLSVSR